MKALLSTTRVLSAVTLAAVGFATAAAGRYCPHGLPGSRGRRRDPSEFVAPEFQGGVAPNRLDVYDLRREMAREAEHDRIRTGSATPCAGAGPPACPGVQAC